MATAMENAGVLLQFEKMIRLIFCSSSLVCSFFARLRAV